MFLALGLEDGPVAILGQSYPRNGAGNSFQRRLAFPTKYACLASEIDSRRLRELFETLRATLFLSLSLSIYQSVYLSFYLSVYLSIYLSVYLSIYLSICQMLSCLSVYLSTYLTIHGVIILFACLSVNMYMCIQIVASSHKL